MDNPQQIRTLLGVSARWTTAEVRKWRMSEGTNFGTSCQLFVDFLLHMYCMFLSGRPVGVLTEESRAPVANVNTVCT